MQALVILVSVVAVTIAYFQWATAYQKVVLDLFDRRLKVYEEAEKGFASVLRTAKCDDEALSDISNALIASRFLFGTDVEEYLKNLRKDFVFLHVYTSEIIRDTADDTERKRLRDEKYAALARILEFPKTAFTVFAPYLRMKQKLRFFWLPG